MHQQRISEAGRENGENPYIINIMKDITPERIQDLW